jgi:hypothetical protein
LAATNFGVTVQVKQLPNFLPNEFFFKNHQKDGEEKWETFARVIRQIMSDESNLKLSDL